MSSNSSAGRYRFRTPVSGLYPGGMAAQPEPGGRDFGELGRARARSRRRRGGRRHRLVAKCRPGRSGRGRSPTRSRRRVETLLDRVVARAVTDPLDVHTVDDVRGAPRGGPDRVGQRGRVGDRAGGAHEAHLVAGGPGDPPDRGHQARHRSRDVVPARGVRARGAGVAARAPAARRRAPGRRPCRAAGDGQRLRVARRGGDVVRRRQVRRREPRRALGRAGALGRARGRAGDESRRDPARPRPRPSTSSPAPRDRRGPGAHGGRRLVGRPGPRGPATPHLGCRGRGRRAGGALGRAHTRGDGRAPLRARRNALRPTARCPGWWPVSTSPSGSRSGSHGRTAAPTGPRPGSSRPRDGERWLGDCAPVLRRSGNPAAGRRRAVPGQRADPGPAPGLTPKSIFQLAGPGAVGPGSLRGMPLLTTLRDRGWAVWPFDPFGPRTVVEVYPALAARRLGPGSGPGSAALRLSDPPGRRRFVEALRPGMATFWPAAVESPGRRVRRRGGRVLARRARRHRTGSAPGGAGGPGTPDRGARSGPRRRADLDEPDLDEPDLDEKVREFSRSQPAWTGAHDPTRDPRGRPGQALRRRRGPVRGLAPGADGHGARPARPQRRGQDHGRAHPDHAAAPRLGPGRGPRDRRVLRPGADPRLASASRASTPRSTRT